MSGRAILQLCLALTCGIVVFSLAASSGIRRARAQDGVPAAEASQSSLALRAPWSEAAAAGFGRVDRYSLTLDARFGTATAPFFTRAFPVVRGHGFVLQAAGAYRLADNMLLEARMPMAMLSIAQPAGSYVDVYTWGNPNFSFLRRDELWHGAGFRLFGVAGASLALPIAQQGPKGSVLGLRALQIASALDALRTQELYVSGALPIAGSYGVLLEGARMGFDANLRLPMFLRFSRAGLPADANPRGFAIAPVLHMGARFAATRWLGLSLAADVVFNALAPVEPERETSSTQFSLAPALSFRLPRSLQLAANFVLPVAGPLGNHVFAGGLQLVFSP